MANIAERLESILKDLQEKLPDIEALVILSQDGLVLSSLLPPETEEDKVAAMTAIAFSLGERALSELDKGSCEEIILKGKKGFILMVNAGEYGGIAVLTSKEAKLGMILYELRKTAQEFMKVMAETLSREPVS